MKIYDWNKLSAKKKAEISAKRALFLAGARDLSVKRLEQLLAKLALTGNFIVGVLKDKYIQGLEDSPQFKALPIESLSAESNLTVLHYYQRDQDYIFKELDFRAVVMVQGSWSRMLHLRPDYWALQRKNTPLKLVSAFTGSAEAKEYPETISKELAKLATYDSTQQYSTSDLMKLAGDVALRSFDWTYQIGAVLARDGKVLAVGHNRVLPYESYMLHKGSSKEANFTPTNDQNHYDTNHAEIELLVSALSQQLDLTGSELFINVMPCPACARALARTEITKIYYHEDHSEGYAFELFKSTGKDLIRI